jgi:signal transduction histidine kinase
MLTALKMELFCLGGKIPGDKKALLNKTKAMSDLIDAAIKTVQRITSALRPTLLDDLGLAAAIDWQVEEFRKRTGISCELVSDTEEFFIDRNVSIAFYRILQEALTNIVRHADANKVKVTFINRPWNKLMLEVSDNGKGITEAQILSTRAFGLTGIRERVYLLGGEVRIKGNEGKGTMLKVEIPHKENRVNL